jgi:spore coat polysaccharide biosynthesis protein SpsF (cytidylyltransferase family)
MNVVAVVQARLDSTRLPGKALADIGGRPMLAQVVERLRGSRVVDQTVIATTELASDVPIVELGDVIGVPVIRGSANDVLGRFLVAGQQCQADVIVRITGDCPLIDASVVDLVVERLLSDGRADYASNVLRRTYPRGLDAEAISLEALRRADKLAQSTADREHVTLIIRTLGEPHFRALSVEDTEDNSDLRLTVDEPDDLELIRILHDRMTPDELRDYRAIVAYLREHPDVREINKAATTWTPESAAAGSSSGRVA